MGRRYSVARGTFKRFGAILFVVAQIPVAALVLIVWGLARIIEIASNKILLGMARMNDDFRSFLYDE